MTDPQNNTQTANNSRVVTAPGLATLNIPTQFTIQPIPVSLSSETRAPERANDNELIESEWVDAMKHILENNRQDPYIVNAAMANLRKYYLHKRYGRDLEEIST
jgi:hypothetical protein